MELYRQRHSGEEITGKGKALLILNEGASE